jgi:hypothetical protein
VVLRVADEAWQSLKEAKKQTGGDDTSFLVLPFYDGRETTNSLTLALRLSTSRSLSYLHWLNVSEPPETQTPLVMLRMQWVFRTDQNPLLELRATQDIKQFQGELAAHAEVYAPQIVQGNEFFLCISLRQTHWTLNPVSPTS